MDEAALREEYPDDEKDGGSGGGDFHDEESLIRIRRKGTGDITDGHIVV